MSKKHDPQAPARVDWTAQAMALPSDQLGSHLPIHVLLGEAADVAGFAARYWEPAVDPATGAVLRPGLSSAGPNLPASIGGEILELARLAQDASTAYRLTVTPSTTAPMDRAHYVLGELTSTLEWLFDDGVTDDNDARLAQLAEAHRDDGDSADAVAGALEDYAALAEPHAREMAGLGGFEVALIAEARTLAAALRAHPRAPGRPASEEAQRKRSLRDRFLILLDQRVARVRSAARFVFRAHPAIAREATSAYQRRRRAAERRAAAKTPPAGAGTPPIPSQ